MGEALADQDPLPADTQDILRDAGHDSVDIGEVVEGDRRVLLKL